MEVADLVEEDGPAMRRLELADRLLEFVEAERLVKHCFRLDRHPGKTVVVAVGDSDDGPGIPAAQLQTLHQLRNVPSVAAQIDKGEAEAVVRKRVLGFVR